SDGDGVGDNADAFPSDANESADTDSDGVGDNADAFPSDASETVDTDSDGVGDNADAFPNDPTRTENDPGAGGEPTVISHLGVTSSLDVSVVEGVKWKAESLSTWIKIIGSGEGIGSGKFFYTAEQNSVTEDRSGRIKISKYVDGSWHVTTVDSEGYSGNSLSLAIDPSDVPVIVYEDDADDGSKNNLKYAVPDPEGRGWVIRNINSPGDRGSYPDFKFGPSGGLSVVYRAGRLVNASFVHDVKYASADSIGKDWTIETIYSADMSPQYHSLSFDQNGLPAVSYNVGTPSAQPNPPIDGLKFSYYTGSEWRHEWVVREKEKGWQSSLIHDANGNPVIAASSRGERRTVSVYSRVNDSWIVAAESTGVASSPSLALRPDGKEALAFSIPEGWVYTINDTINDDDNWSNQVVDDDVNFPLSLDLKSDGHPAIAYIDDTQKHVKYAAFDGSEWNIETLPIRNDKDKLRYPSLDHKSDGTPVIAYFSGSETADLLVAELTAWDLAGEDHINFLQKGFVLPVIEPAAFTTLEHYAKGTFIATLGGGDPIGENVTFSIAQNPDGDGDGQGAFQIVGIDLLVNDPDDLDYAKEPSMLVLIRMSGGGQQQEIPFTVNLLQDSDRDGLPNDYETGNGIFVSITDAGTDPNNPDTDGDGFLDGEEAFGGTDPNSLFSFPDVNKPPVIESQDFQVYSGAVKDTIVGAVVASDPNGDQILFSIAKNIDLDGDGVPAFRIIAGQLIIRDDDDLNNAPADDIQIDIRASDRTLSTVKTFNIAVIGSASIEVAQHGSEPGSLPIIFELSRSGSITRPMSIQVILRGTAIVGKDYELPDGFNDEGIGTVEFGNNRTVSLSLPTLKDGDVIDPGKTLLAVLRSNNNQQLTPGKARALAVINADGIQSTPNKIGYSLSSVNERRNSRAFALLKDDGSVVTWGNSSYGGNSLAVADELASNKVVQVYSAGRAFAALTEKGSVISWGRSDWGGDSSLAAARLDSGVISIASNYYAFAAIKEDRSVVTWGGSSFGGNSSAVANRLRSVVEVFRTDRAFAALKEDGSVITWGQATAGGSSVSVKDELSSGVVQIMGNREAFAALKEDGSVVGWGNQIQGGFIASAFSDLLSSGVVELFASDKAFAALKDDGSIVSWGALMSDALEYIVFDI
ncbi:MAG: hypothetical protein ABGY96_13635, partial [bacterium]